MNDNQYKTISWGIILIVLGVFLLLSNLDIIDFSFRQLIHLWPVILIYWGITALPVNNTVKLILVLIAFSITLALLFRFPVYHHFDLNLHRI